MSRIPAGLRKAFAPTPELSAEEKICRLTDELRLLKPYASTTGLGRLKRRVAEIEAAVSRLRGLPLDD